MPILYPSFSNLSNNLDSIPSYIIEAILMPIPYLSSSNLSNNLDSTLKITFYIELYTNPYI